MKKKYKIIIGITLFIVFSVLVLFIFVQTTAKSDSQNQFIVMSTTDLHGQIWDESLEYQESEPTSMLAEATAVKQIRDNFGDKTVLFDNGDLYQGTSLSTIDIPKKNTDVEESANPTSKCMKEIAYDGYTLGNHEFNYNTDDMQKCHKYLEGSAQLVCANIYYPGNGKHVYKPYMTKNINVDGQNIKIGIIGLTNTDIPRWDNAVNYENWIFHSPENTNADIAYEIEKAQDEMKANNDICDFTIVSYHGGFFPEGVSNNVNSENYTEKLDDSIKDPLVLYKNTESQGYRALKQTSGIDMFILGHDHLDIYSNSQHKNADGKDVLVVNGAKKSLTESVFEVSKESNGKIKINLIESQNKKLENFKVDGNLKAKIKPYADSLNRLYDTDVCTFDGNWNFDHSSTEYYTKQTDYADLLNRTQVWSVKKGLSNYYKNNSELNNMLKKIYGKDTNLLFDESEDMDCDISLTTVSPPKKFDSKGTIKFRDVTKLFAYDNTTEYVPVKGSDIKDLLEYNASDRYAVKTNANGEKSIVVENDKYTCPVVWGLNFTYNMNKPAGQRVNIEGFSNGKKFDANKTYMMVMSNYLRGNTANPILEKLGHKNISIDTKIVPGSELVRLTLAEYFKYIDEKYGAVYPTNQINKNGEVASHWEIKF